MQCGDQLAGGKCQPLPQTMTKTGVSVCSCGRLSVRLSVRSCATETLKMHCQVANKWFLWFIVSALEIVAFNASIVKPKSKTMKGGTCFASIDGK